VIDKARKRRSAAQPFGEIAVATDIAETHIAAYLSRLTVVQQARHNQDDVACAIGFSGKSVKS
jgi:hypothetical protein